MKSHWYYILLALAADDRHGLAIAREVQHPQRRAGPALARDRSTARSRISATVAGFDGARRRAPAPADESERKRYYRITRAGRAAR